MTTSRRIVPNRAFFTYLPVMLFVLIVLPATMARGDDAKQADSSSSETIRLKFRTKSGGQQSPRVEVTGLTTAQLKRLASRKPRDEAWQKLLRVSVDDARVNSPRDQPAILGSYGIEANKLVFQPRFPFLAGMKYQARLDLARLVPRSEKTRPIVLRFGLPKPPPSPPATITHVFPSRSTLPENLLKFYIHFSEPMSRGEAYTRVRLLNSDGKAIEFPFLELGEELWDHRATRFTLFFDPGRIKRGLQPRKLFGPALETGKTYTLVVDRKWKDAKGRPLKASYRKTFKVSDPDDTQPDPAKWKISAPSAAGRDPLEVRFPDPLDHALLHRMLVVKDSTGRVVQGTIRVDRQETRWRFTPSRPWTRGRYELEIDTTLEDLSGNSVGRPFEIDVVRPIRKKVEKKTVSLPFRVKTASK